VQKAEALTRCAVCGAHYTRGDAADERLHDRVHARHLQGVKLPAWHDLRSATASAQLCAAGERIVVIAADASARQIAKARPEHAYVAAHAVSHDLTAVQPQVREVCELVEGSTGCEAAWITAVPITSFLFLRGQQVLGLLALQPLSRANRVTVARPPPPDASKADAAAQPRKARRIEAAPAAKPAKPKAVCGVRALWVNSAHRRRGLASKLLDAARAECTRGYVPFRREVAFAQACDEGLRFAAAYCGSDAVLLFAGN